MWPPPAGTEISTLVCPEPIQLIERSGAQLRVTQEAHAFLHSPALQGKPLVVASIVGTYRSAKSFLLNRLLRQQKGFKSTAASQGVTRGIWLWGEHLPDGRVLLVLDTEGLSDPENNNQADAGLFVLVTLVSSLLMLNIENVINAHALSELSFVANMAGSVCIGGSAPADRTVLAH